MNAAFHLLLLAGTLAPGQFERPQEAAVPVEGSFKPDWVVVTASAAHLKHGNTVIKRIEHGMHMQVLAEKEKYILVEWDGVKGWLSKPQVSSYLNAYKFFSQQIAEKPTAAAYHHRGQIGWMNDDEQLFAQSLDDISQAIRLEPTRATAFWDRAGLRCRMGDPEGGIADFEKAAALDSEHLPPMQEAYYQIADSYERKGDEVSARTWRQHAQNAP